MEIRVKNKKIDEDLFFKIRKEVLSNWPTGREVDLDEAVEYQKTLPEHKNFMKVVERLHNDGESVVFPRAGTPILEQEIELNKTLVEAGLPLIPMTPDSYSRLGNFDKAQQGLEESIRLGKPMLNGYPTVVHGVKNTRKVVEETDAALNQRLTNLGGVQLLAEIAFASGMTAALVDPILTFGWYEKNPTAAECIEHYQYIHRLIGYYAERGVIITVDIDGASANIQFPMSVDLAGVITTALIAAEQGVRSVIPWSYMYGHMAQDIAWANVARRLMREYLNRFEFQNVAVPGVFLAQVPLFPYPQEMGWCFGFLNYSAMVGALAGGEGIYLRTIDEGAGIPTKEAHAVSYRSAKWIFDVIRAQKINLDIEELRIEERITEMEVRAILERILELGEGDIAVGYERGVRSGIIDSPLGCNKHYKGKVMGIRDLRGACRYLDPGDLPIPKEALEFHREKVIEREKAEGKKMDFRTVISDFWALSKGRLIGNHP